MEHTLVSSAFVLATFFFIINSGSIWVRSSKLEALNITEDAPWIYTEMMLRIQEEGNFDTCLIFADAVELKHHHFLIGIIEQHLRIPLLLYETKTVFNNSFSFKNNILTVVLLKETTYNATAMNNLARNLNRIRRTRILFIGRGSTELVFLEELSQLFLHCEARKMLNAIAIFDNFPTDEKYYSYHSFPEFHLEILDFRSPTRQLYPERMHNLHGFAIRTLPDQRIPVSVAYYDQQGHQQTAGYVHKFLTLYASMHNASIVQPFPVVVGEVLYRQHMATLTNNDVIDIPTGLSSPDEEYNYNDYFFTYPLEVATLCLMVPMEQPKTNANFFQSFLKYYFLLIFFVFCLFFSILTFFSRKLVKLRQKKRFRINFLDIVFNMPIYSGLLGLPSLPPADPQPTMRVVYFLIFFAGLMVLVNFNSQLSSFMTSPPLEATIITWQDFVDSPLKLLISRDEFEENIKDNRAGYTKNMESIIVLETFKEFTDVRDTFNASYGYPVASARWNVFETQQTSFTRPLYRHTDVCFRPLIHNCLMLDSNSIFLETLNSQIMQAHDMGLVNYWLKWSYVELVAIGNVTMPTKTKITELPRLSMSDFSYVWQYVLINWGVSLIVFALEWLLYIILKRKKFFSRTTKPKARGVERRKRKVFIHDRNIFETSKHDNGLRL